MFKLNVIRKHSFARTKKHRLLRFCFFVFLFHVPGVLCVLSEKIYIAVMVCIPESDAVMLL